MEDENSEVRCSGCAANSMGKRAGETESHPACAICFCFDVAEEQPSLSTRRARARMEMGNYWYDTAHLMCPDKGLVLPRPTNRPTALSVGRSGHKLETRSVWLL